MHNHLYTFSNAIAVDFYNFWLKNSIYRHSIHSSISSDFSVLTSYIIVLIYKFVNFDAYSRGATAWLPSLKSIKKRLLLFSQIEGKKQQPPSVFSFLRQTFGNLVHFTVLVLSLIHICSSDIGITRYPASRYAFKIVGSASKIYFESL